MKLFLVLLLSITAWVHPAKAASALLAEPPLEETPAINYGPYEPTKEAVVLEENPSPSSPGVRTKPKPKVQAESSEYSGRNYSKEEVQELIRSYSAQYGIDPEAPLCIARKESGFHQFSKNKSSSASGVFQYVSGTWKATDEGKTGRNVFDADSNIKAAVKYMASRGNARPWTVASSCPPIKSIN